MPLRLWTGTSGQGKSYKMIEDVIRQSKENPDQNYYLIVPEQFGLETQHALIDRHPDHGYFNIDVLSFHRLAYQMFEEVQFLPEDILEDLGVSMVLRKILSEHESELLYFKRSAKKAGFIDELKSVLMEMICYGVSAEQLLSSGEALTNHPNLSHKCKEIGKIYQYFEEYIEGRFMVSEQILDVALDLIPQSSMLKKGVFYFDGFTGFTPVQLKFLEGMLRQKISLEISVTLDTLPFGRRAEDKEELFHLSYRTVEALHEICKRAGDLVEEPNVFCEEIPPRYQNAPELAIFEKQLFRVGNQKVYVSKEEDQDSNQVIPSKHFHVTSCRNLDAEAVYITHKIEELVRREGYRYRDIAVLSADADGYASAFKRQSDILHIPMFQDIKKKMSYYSGIETIRAIFHLAEMDYSYESVFRYLKSGMADFDAKEVDFLENYVLYAGIRGLSGWRRPFSRRLERYTEEQVAHLEALRVRLLEETEQVCLALRDKEANVTSKMTALYNTFVALQYDEKLKAKAKQEEILGDYTKMREYQRLYDMLLELLDKIVAIFGEEKMSLKILTEVMDAGLESMKLGIEPLSMDQVILGDLKRTRLPGIKVLFIAGFNDGMIPPVLEDMGLIHDEEKLLLEEFGITLSDDLYGKSLEDEFYLYLAFTKPQEQIYFTYSDVGTDGKTIRPSTLLADLEKMIPGLTVRSFPEEEIRHYFNAEDSREMLVQNINVYRKDYETGKQDQAFAMLLRYWNDILGEEEYLNKIWTEHLQAGTAAPLTHYLAKELYGEELVGSVTKLEKYASCPYAFFCNYGLFLKEREEFRIQSFDIGNIFHGALEHFAKEIKESEYTWKTLPTQLETEFIKSAMANAVDDRLSDVLKSSARNGHKLAMVERILTRTVSMLRDHLKKSAFEPDQFELSFGRHDKLESSVFPLSHGNHMRLEGVVDRVDIVEEDDQILLKIIDYKSGNKSLELTDLYQGINLQLVIYMNAAKEIYEKNSGKTVIPAGLYYYTLKDPILKLEKGKAPDHRKEFRMQGLTNDDPNILSMIEELEDGKNEFSQINVRIKKDGSPYADAQVAKTDDFYALGSYAHKKAQELGERIYSGEIQAHPYKKDDKHTGCSYCPYVSVCGFDPAVSGYEYQEMLKLKNADLLKKIYEEL